MRAIDNMGPAADEQVADGAQRYAGKALDFEGGPRGANFGSSETLPSMAPYPKKIGYDEHRGSRAQGSSVHGVPGVEGIPQTGSDSDDDEDDHGLSCPHGCGGSMKTAHGLARHIKAAHGGFGGLGKALREKL